MLKQLSYNYYDSLTSKLLSDFDKKGNQSQLENINEYVTIVENSIQVCILDEVAKYFAKYGGTRLPNRSNGSFRYFELYKTLYFAAISPDIANVNHLKLLVKADINCNCNPKNNISKIISLDYRDLGRVNKVEILLPIVLEPHLDNVTLLVDHIYRSCYAWLNEYIFRVVMKCENDIAKSLYSRLRTLLSSDNKMSFYDKIWFVFLDRQTNLGFHITDAHKAIAANNTFISKNIFSNFSGGELFSALYTDRIQIDKMFSDNTVRENRVVEYEHKKAKYKDEAAYYFAEKIIFNQAKFVQYPIVSEGKFQLTATYNCEFKHELNDFFDKHVAVLQGLFKDNLKATLCQTNSIHMHKHEKSFATQLGEFIAGLLNGLLHAH